ncbi:MAG: pentapeptide repeat-containing protein, partial [Pseudomonadota bacterium]
RRQRVGNLIARRESRVQTMEDVIPFRDQIADALASNMAANLALAAMVVVLVLGLTAALRIGNRALMLRRDANDLSAEASLEAAMLALGDAESDRRVMAATLVLRRLGRTMVERKRAPRTIPYLKPDGRTGRRNSRRDIERDAVSMAAALLRAAKRRNVGSPREEAAEVVADETSGLGAAIGEGLARLLDRDLDRWRETATRPRNVPKPERQQAALYAMHGTPLDWRGVDLRGVWWHGVDVRRIDFRGSDLSDAELRDADFNACVLREARLSGAMLRKADLRGADLTEANFRNASLEGADMGGARIDAADFTGATFDRHTIPPSRETDLAALGLRLVGPTVEEAAIVPPPQVGDDEATDSAEPVATEVMSEAGPTEVSETDAAVSEPTEAGEAAAEAETEPDGKSSETPFSPQPRRSIATTAAAALAAVRGKPGQRSVDEVGVVADTGGTATVTPPLDPAASAKSAPPPSAGATLGSSKVTPTGSSGAEASTTPPSVAKAPSPTTLADPPAGAMDAPQGAAETAKMRMDERRQAEQRASRGTQGDRDEAVGATDRPSLEAAARTMRGPGAEPVSDESTRSVGSVPATPRSARPSGEERRGDPAPEPTPKAPPEPTSKPESAAKPEPGARLEPHSTQGPATDPEAATGPQAEAGPAVATDATTTVSASSPSPATPSAAMQKVEETDTSVAPPEPSIPRRSRRPSLFKNPDETKATAGSSPVTKKDDAEKG